MSPKYSIPTGLYIDIITQGEVVGGMAKQFFCNCTAGITKTSNHHKTGCKPIITGINRFVTSTWWGNNIVMICSFSQANPQKYEWLKHLRSNEKWILDKQRRLKTNRCRWKEQRQRWLRWTLHSTGDRMHKHTLAVKQFSGVFVEDRAEPPLAWHGVRIQ